MCQGAGVQALLCYQDIPYAGKALIHSLPEMAARPDMTAHWESVLTQISEKQCRYQDFMQPLVGTLYQLIEQAKKARLLRRQAVRPNKRKAIWPDDGIK